MQRAALLDLAEEKLREAVERGDRWAIEFVLKTLGGSRGYAAKSSRQTKDPLEIIVTHE
jgi:hypothetical protein